MDSGRRHGWLVGVNVREILPPGLDLPADGTVTMFSTTWCGYCRRLKSQLDREGIGYTEINIETTPGTAELVETINRGNQTVPTVVFPDGSAVTNPSLAQIKAKLAELA